jgi:predicted permease
MATALFSLTYAVLLRPLPYPEQESLRVIWRSDPRNEIPFLELGYPELSDLKENIEAFESVALMTTTTYGYGRTVQANGQLPFQVDAALVSPDFFRTLGAQPILGHDFPRDTQEDRPMAILGERVWRQHFDADRDIVGQEISLDGQGYTVVGVMGAEVQFPRGAALWLPARKSESRGATSLQAIARIAAGYSDEQVRTQLRALFSRTAQQFPEFYSASHEPVIFTLAEYWTRSSRSELLLSFGAALLLLITACTTASTLFVSRTLGRTREISTRVSLGASQRQILSQFAVEGLVAGTAAGGVGLAIAWALTHLLVAWAPEGMPRIAEASLNAKALAFAIAVSIVATLACSLLSMWLAVRLNPATVLREGGSRLTVGRTGRRIQGVFTLIQAAVTVVLLAAASLIGISLQGLVSENIGFTNRDAITMNLALRGRHFSASDRDTFYTTLLDRLRQYPNVSSAGAMLLGPLQGSIGWDIPYDLDVDSGKPEQELPMANFQVVTPGYFETVGTPLLEGRDFSSGDNETTERVAVIGRNLAELIRKNGAEPLGSRLRLWKQLQGSTWRVVGVVADTRQRGVARATDDVYLPYLQTTIQVRYPVVRGTGSTAELAELVRREARRLDPSLAVAEVSTIEQLVDRDTAPHRFSLALLAIFAIGAVLLAGASVYSVVSESVSVRRREIAIRMALGAQRSRLVGSLAYTTLFFVTGGLIVGLFGVLGLGTNLAPLLYQINPREPTLLACVLAFVFVIAVLAAVIPGLVATGAEPGTILQDD